MTEDEYKVKLNTVFQDIFNTNNNGGVQAVVAIMVVGNGEVRISACFPDQAVFHIVGCLEVAKKNFIEQNIKNTVNSVVGFPTEKYTAN